MKKLTTVGEETVEMQPQVDKWQASTEYLCGKIYEPCYLVLPLENFENLRDCVSLLLRD